MPQAQSGGGGSTSIAAQIFSFLTGKGLSPAVAAGVEGNLAQESSLNPDEQGGYLAQWGGARLQGLEAYAASIGQPADSLDAQLGWLWQEMESGSGFSGGSLQGLESQQTPGEAALYFSNTFERPASWAADNTNREEYAQIYYNEFTAGGSGAGAPQGGTGSGSVQDMSTSSGSSGGGFLSWLNPFSHQQQSSAPDTIQNGTVGFFQGLDDALQMPGFTITNPVGSILQDGKALAFRSFLFLVGLLLIAFGLLALVGEDFMSEQKGMPNA